MPSTKRLTWADVPDEPINPAPTPAPDSAPSNVLVLPTLTAENMTAPPGDLAENAIEALKSRLPSIPEMVPGLVRETDGSLKGPCPRCGGKDRFVFKTKTGRFFCRRCNPRGGDLVDFHQWIDGSSVADLKRRYSTMGEVNHLRESNPVLCPAKGDESTVHSPVDDQAGQTSGGTAIDADEVWKRAQENASFLLNKARQARLCNYLTTQRKIPEHVVNDAIRQDRLCYSTGRFHATAGQTYNSSAVFKYETILGETRTVQVIDIEDVAKPKMFFKGLQAGDAFFFAGRSFDEADTVCVVEAPTNALSGAAVLPGLCWVAVGSSVMVKKLGAMGGYRKTFVLAFDCDEAGLKGTEQAVRVLAGEDVKSVKWPDGTQTGYDLNDLLKAGQEDGIRELIEQAVPVVSEKSSKGDEVVAVSLLDILANPCEQVPIIKGVNYEEDALLIHGGGGTGKSLWAMQVALELAACNTENPTMLWGRLIIPEPRTTLFLQSENNNAVIFKRISRMIQGKPGLRKGLNRIFFAGSSNHRAFLTGRCLTDHGFLAELKSQIDMIERTGQRKLDVLVVDPLVSFHEADENDNPGMRRVLDTIMGFCDQLKITPWIIHHDGKQGDSRGASAIHDWTRSRVHLVAEKGINRNIVKVIHEKSNNSKRFDPFFIELDERSLLFEVAEFSGGPSKKDLKEQENLKLVLRTVKAMGGRARNQAEILKALTSSYGIPKTTALRHIRLAIDKRYIIEQSDGLALSPYDKI